MKCGLLGRKLGHSYSPAIHSLLGDYPYELFEVEPDELKSFLKSGDFTGLNVTMPYKQAVIPYLDEVTPIAQKLGAVNTIVRRDGRLIGHNTDYFGFQILLKQSGLNLKGKKALVLGSGGASKTCVAALEIIGAKVIVISRNGDNNYGNLQLHADAAILVNATPLGMYPNTGVSPVDLACFPRLEGVVDVVYNPARTQLILDAEERGICAVSGLWMLVAQAKEASEWFTGRQIPDSEIERVYSHLQRQMQNIILTGMPGCGKSTLGRTLAERLHRPFVDLDSCIEERAGMPIATIFAKYGQAYFRRLETAAAAEYGKRSGFIIATGGGIVTESRNYPLLHQNGRIFWLQRELDKLSIEGRPLSQAGALEDMYIERKPLYEAFADYSVDNNGSLDATISQILEVLP